MIHHAHERPFARADARNTRVPNAVWRGHVGTCRPPKKGYMRQMAIELNGCVIESTRCMKMHQMYEMYTWGYIIFLPLYCPFCPLFSPFHIYSYIFLSIHSIHYGTFNIMR